MKLGSILLTPHYQKNREKQNRLKEALGEKDTKGESWVFCLGAGVSMSCGLPNWGILLAMLSARMLCSVNVSFEDESENELGYNLAEQIRKKNTSDEFHKQLRASMAGSDADVYCGIDYLELAEYVHAGIKRRIGKYGVRSGDDEKAADLMLKELIGECFEIEKGTGKEPFQKYKGSTLQYIARIMKSRKIYRAATYNYDNLLEIALRTELGVNTGAKKHAAESVCSVLPEEHREFSEEEGIWKVFHFHGRVPVRMKSDAGIDASEYEQPGGKVILSEESYYDEEHYHYSSANVLQSYMMNNCNVIYVGFSGSDYTFRRIIKGMHKTEKEKCRSYIFFCVDDIVNGVYQKVREDMKSQNQELEKQEFLEKLDKEYVYWRLLINHIIIYKELYWDEKGFEVIWTTIEELPGILKSLSAPDGSDF